MRTRHDKVRHHILFLRGNINHTHTTALLRLVLAWVGALYIATCRKHENGFLVRYEVFYGNIFHATLDYLGATLIPVLLTHSHELFAYHSQNVLL